MARSNLPSFDVRPQYFSLIENEAGRVLGQVRSINPSDSIETVRAGRVGSSTKKTLKKSKDTNLSVEVWSDSDNQEIGIFLGAASLPTTGSTIKLDPSTTPKNFYIKNYDSEDSAASLLSTTYLYQFEPTEYSFTLDSEGEQVVSISGTLEDLYTVNA